MYSSFNWVHSAKLGPLCTAYPEQISPTLLIHSSQECIHPSAYCTPEEEKIPRNDARGTFPGKNGSSFALLSFLSLPRSMYCTRRHQHFPSNVLYAFRLQTQQNCCGTYSILQGRRGGFVEHLSFTKNGWSRKQQRVDLQRSCFLKKSDWLASHRSIQKISAASSSRVDS